ncbi:hypothetical protein KUTeg_023960 [Tegillarca granosa]|uniref:LON peptidase N-terminal domain and RING finger protein 1 n=1 Tax=Tegillarca granosa TaxID=220873 RepID=A0ABQ9DWK1_TEGGR|nr:hypothetical protein KUTeg_023960 [Tegillarca granosa]
MYWDAPVISHGALNRDDMDCSLCYRLLFTPVTTPCGHTFCRPCLDRCLDHQSQCPLCKSSLAETETIHTCAYQMLNDTQHVIPIFVCAMAYPGIACPLHIFEPRYRLMIRQCMESGIRQFGMCVSNGENDEDFADFGTMLEIRDVQFFPDGRSLVDTIGGKRFKVISRARRDGYNTAKVEFTEDTPVSAEQYQEVSNLQTEVFTMCKNWFESLPGLQREHIIRHLGSFPDIDIDFQNNTNGPVWLWWLLGVLPLDPRIRLTLLAMSSFKERLEGVKRVVQFVTETQRSMTSIDLLHQRTRTLYFRNDCICNPIKLF